MYASDSNTEKCQLVLVLQEYLHYFYQDESEMHAKQNSFKFWFSSLKGKYTKTRHLVIGHQILSLSHTPTKFLDKISNFYMDKWVNSALNVKSFLFYEMAHLFCAQFTYFVTCKIPPSTWGHNYRAPKAFFKNQSI